MFLGPKTVTQSYQIHAYISFTRYVLMTSNSSGKVQKLTEQGQQNRKMAKDKGKKKSHQGRPSPEEIIRIRKEREARREIRAKLIAEGRDPDDPQHRPYFKKRELLEVPHSAAIEHIEGGIPLKIMTYNLLAQTLIRRSMFPDNGRILKWTVRSKPLYQEVKYYDCDIICMQEMDYSNYQKFWTARMKELGYEGHFNRNQNKSHGVAIFFRKSMFAMIDHMHIQYDIIETAGIEPRTTTQNVGIVLALSLRGHQNNIVLIGTTHLFWHPFGTYERTRQTAILLMKAKEFERRVKVLHPEKSKVWSFFAGDFNSQPFDSPYLSITSKPVHYDDRCKTVIGCSTSFEFSNKRDGGGGEEEEGGNVEVYGENQPKTPVPDRFDPTVEQQKMVAEMEKLHNALPYRAISLYSVAYGLVDPKNSGLDNSRNEPFFSNWAHTWRGLLDYIFVIRDWDGKEDNRAIDSLEKFETENHIRLNSLLRMPHPEEMDKGLPREYLYPSDHLCMVAQVSLL